MPPNEVKAAILEALANSSRVLHGSGARRAAACAFDASAITYRARFWVDDYEHDERRATKCGRRSTTPSSATASRSRGRSRSSTEREWTEPDPTAQHARAGTAAVRRRSVRALPPEVRQEIAASTPTTVYGSGEAIVRQGEAGQSMFVVASGARRVVLEPGARRSRASSAAGISARCRC